MSVIYREGKKTIPTQYETLATKNTYTCQGSCSCECGHNQRTDYDRGQQIEQDSGNQKVIKTVSHIPGWRL